MTSELITSPSTGDKIGFYLKQKFIPCGTITEIDESSLTITTSSSRKFFRRSSNGLWYYRRIWPMYKHKFD